MITFTSAEDNEAEETQPVSQRINVDMTKEEEVPMPLQLKQRQR